MTEEEYYNLKAGDCVQHKDTKSCFELTGWFDCIIPKGTRYVMGKGCQAVAEKVIIREMYQEI